MGDEFAALAGEVLDYCKDAGRLDACASWSDLDDWLASSTTEVSHEYENSLALRAVFGDDLAAIKNGLLVHYVAKNIARRLVALRSQEEIEGLRRQLNDGLLDDQEYASESQTLAREHARIYERLDL
jgi:hypothetical protein